MKQLFFSFFLLISLSGYAQHQDKVDFIRAEVSIKPIPLEKRIDGFAVYQFEILQDVDSIFLDAKNMEFLSVRLDGKKVKYSNDGKIISIKNKFKEGKNHKLKLTYTCTPKQTVYFLGWDDAVEGNEQIWTQGQGKYTSHWLPSFDDMEEKLEFDLSFNSHLGKNIEITNGIVKEVKSNHNGGTIVSFDMQKPMSSYLLAFVIGNYEKQELKSASGIPIENYYYPQDSLKVEPTYRYTKEIFDFLEEEIGFPYPWQNYKQIPVRDFLYAGMENTGTTIFSDQYVIDSTAFVDKNYVNVNAHEMAHQWFGNLVTEKDGNHHWLHEGFATYYAYLAEQHLFGDDHFYWKLFNTAKELQSVSDKGEGQALIDPKSSSLTFYEKGAWALVMLRDKIGDDAFKKGVSAYLVKHKFKNVTIDDFLKEMEVASGTSLDGFKAKWLQSTEFPAEEVKTFLMTKSSSIRMFYVSKLLYRSSHMGQLHNQIEHIELDWLKEDEPTQYKEALVDEFSDELTFSQALMLLPYPHKIRQKGVQLLDKNPDHKAYLDVDMIKEIIEKSLDSSESYVTQELALYKLWSFYPENKKKYLDQTKDVIGLPNKNVRLLWLTLAMLSDGYETLKTKEYFQELSSYTSPEHSFEIRQGAFFYLKEAFGFNEQGLANLVKATGHHSWQFRKFARNLLDELLVDEDYILRLEKLFKELNPEETRYLSSKLKIE